MSQQQPTATAARTFVAYARVSTAEQGRSGLGLEAQQAAITAFLLPGDRLLSPLFVEVESGKRSDRPKLREAIARCRATGAVLLVAKLDRLSRNLPFLRSLIDGDVGVAFGDMPNVPAGAMGRFILTQMAAVAELEAGLVSERTKAALAAVKVRWAEDAARTGEPLRTLGGDRGYRPSAPPDGLKGSAAAAVARARAASQAAWRVLPAIEAARAAGATSLNALATALNAQGVPSTGGGTWTATTVRRALARTGEPMKQVVPEKVA